VEAVVKAHESIYDAVVIGVPHDRWGHQVAAVVSAHAPDAVDFAALAAQPPRGRLIVVPLVYPAAHRCGAPVAGHPSRSDTFTRPATDGAATDAPCEPAWATSCGGTA
ncbi:AMP-binding enzyme, partial [Nocardia wallacei]|uniref:AMP-binding enzyme n=1 Tax=Nocardia wallacei TaxID=480035 RepID=UPI003CC7DEE2